MDIHVVDAFSSLSALPTTSLLSLISMYALGIAYSSTKDKNPWKKWVESDKNFHLFANRLRDAIVIVDHEGRVAYWNPAAEHLFGYTMEEVLEKDVHQLLAPDRYRGDYERGLQNFNKTGRGDALGNVLELKALTKSGKEIPVELSLSALELDGKMGAVAVIRDISGRKKMEKQLRDSEEKLTNALEALNIGRCLTKNRTILWVNNSFSKMLGYAPEELIGKSTRTLYKTKEEFDRVGSILNLLGSEKTVIEQEIKLLRKDGFIIDCLFRAALLQPFSEERTIISMVEDITEKKMLEAQLNQAQKMEAVGILAGGVAHDFNNILTTIMGNAELALMDLDKNSSFKTYLDEILKASRRGASLTRQLLAFSRKQLVQPRLLNLNEVIKDLESMLQRLIGEDIHLVINYKPDLGNIEADPGQMQQIVMNLAVNARDAMPQGGTLTITTANVELDEQYFLRRGLEPQPGPYVRMEISDTGVGMDEATKMRIFEPFFTTKGPQKGTGLGLSTVYGIVKQNKGYIWVYSELGRGSTFEIYLPIADRVSRMRREGRPRLSPSQGTEKILLVEDDESLRETTAEMLRMLGYRVLKAKSGKEALAVLAQGKGSIDLMLTDIIMPGMSGKELAERVTQEFPNVKIILMSGYAGDILINHGILEQEWEFIQKPFTSETLTRKIREALESRSDSSRRSQY